MSGLQPAQLTESPVAESIQKGRMAICQQWEQRFPALVCGSGRPLPLLAPGLILDSKLLGFFSLSVSLRFFSDFRVGKILTLGHLALSIYKLCVSRSSDSLLELENLFCNSKAILRFCEPLKLQSRRRTPKRPPTPSPRRWISQ